MKPALGPVAPEGLTERKRRRFASRHARTVYSRLEGVQKQAINNVTGLLHELVQVRLGTLGGWHVISNGRLAPCRMRPILGWAYRGAAVPDRERRPVKTLVARRLDA